LNADDVTCLEIGAGILGTGGGASPYIGGMVCKKLLNEGKRLRIICHDDMKDEDHSVIGAFLGAPTVGIEKIITGNEILDAFRMIEKMNNGKKKISSLMSVEIGGMNSLAPCATAALLDLPLVDVDGMGRAFP
jgi:DUF917 family protein